MGNFIKVSTLAAALALSGCVTVDAGSLQNTEASGENAGRLVVFGLDNLGAETVAISVNDQFIAPLQANKQFTQGLCSGSYQLEARSVNAFAQGKKVARVVEQQYIQIEPQHTTYIEVSRGSRGWVLQTVGQEEWQAKTANVVMGATDSKIVRRLTPALVNCK